MVEKHDERQAQEIAYLRRHLFERSQLPRIWVTMEKEGFMFEILAMTLGAAL